VSPAGGGESAARCVGAAKSDNEARPLVHYGEALLTESDVRRAVTPLRMIFWGGLLWIIDVKFTSTTNGEGFAFDVFNDTLAAVLITVALFRLSGFAVHARYDRAMRFLKIVGVLSIAQTAFGHLVFRRPEALSLLLQLFSLVQLAGTVVFCVAMRWFCEEAGLVRSASSWRLTTILFIAIFVVPLGLFYVAGLIAVLTGESFHINLGPAGLLLLPLFAAPLVHLFVSTSRMMRETPGGGPRGFEVLPLY
jgi:hypothetical protein